MRGTWRLVVLFVAVFVLVVGWGRLAEWRADVEAARAAAEAASERARPEAVRPEEVGEDMSELGMTEPLDERHEFVESQSIATAFPYRTGAPANSYYYGNFVQPIGEWPATIIPVADQPDDYCYSTYAVLDGDGVPTALWAYLAIVSVSHGVRVAAGLYDEAGNLVVGSDDQLISDDYEGWIEFPVSTGTSLSVDTSYCLWVVTTFDAMNDSVQLAEGDIGDYVPPPNPPPVAIGAEDTIVLGEHLRHGGVLAPCAGRYIKPEPEEHYSNPHRGRS